MLYNLDLSIHNKLHFLLRGKIWYSKNKTSTTVSLTIHFKYRVFRLGILHFEWCWDIINAYK
jgi:hypothetical protein